MRIIKNQILFFVLVELLFSVSLFSYKPLTFKERVKAQETIERVYYSHRIWPKENKTSKPSFEETISKEVIENKVENYIKSQFCWRRFGKDL